MLDRKFSEFDNFVFDLDGTVWYWTRLIEKASSVFSELRRQGKRAHFVTNNTLLTREGFAKKLQGFGISARPEQITTPSEVAARLFRNRKVFCIGEGMITELRKEKIALTDHKPDVVVMAEDRSITYDKLAKACILVEEGAKFYKTAEGRIFFYGNRRIPGGGALAAVIESCTYKKAELIGKPSEHMMRAVRELGLNPEKTISIGDELNTDILMGNKLGFATALALSGRDKKKDYDLAKGGSEPDFVLKSIADLVK
ncbi:MAG: HAD-IIA family hydrolase [Nanoarchaeota archaeon]|nr:HAD-IIA family hydrolase [Nanoarchaeota archaeon]